MPAKSGRKSRWTPATQAQVYEMADKGISQADIARSFGTTQQTISRLLASRETHTAPAASGQSEWSAIASDTDAWLSTQTNPLVALQRISAAYIDVADRADLADLAELVAEREQILAAYRGFEWSASRPLFA
jgi:transposase-like protein